MSEPAKRKPTKRRARTGGATHPARARGPKKASAAPVQPAWHIRVLRALRADITRSGFVMTLLAVAALIVSAVNLQVSGKQDPIYPADVAPPYGVDHPGSQIIKPDSLVPSPFDPAGTNGWRPFCETPSLPPASSFKSHGFLTGAMSGDPRTRPHVSWAA